MPSNVCDNILGSESRLSFAIVGNCDFCQSGSLRAALDETLTAYPAAGGEQCKGLGK